MHDLVITLKSKRKDFEPPTSQCFLLRKTQKSGFITIMINNNYSGLTFRPLVKHHWFPKLDDTIKIKTLLLILLVEERKIIVPQGFLCRCRNNLEKGNICGVKDLISAAVLIRVIRINNLLPTIM